MISLHLKKLKIREITLLLLLSQQDIFFHQKSLLGKYHYFVKKNNICLIIDEITTGWRETLGGIYKKVGFRPDIVVFGKGMGNGYPISCIIGKKIFSKQMKVL